MKANRIIYAIDKDAGINIVSQYRYVYAWHFHDWDTYCSRDYYLELDPAENCSDPANYNVKLIMVADLSEQDLMVLTLQGHYRGIIPHGYLSVALKKIFCDNLEE